MIAGGTSERLRETRFGNLTLTDGFADAVSGCAIAVIVPFLIFLLVLSFILPNFLILTLPLILTVGFGGGTSSTTVYSSISLLLGFFSISQISKI